jgi:hypothetical protein
VSTHIEITPVMLTTLLMNYHTILVRSMPSMQIGPALNAL